MLAILLVMLGSCERAVESNLAGIAVDSLFTLEIDGAPAAPVFTARLAMRRDGGAFVLAPSSRPGELLVLDESGRYMRAFARRGAGPGELAQVDALVFDAGDSLWVFGAGRADLWDPDYRFVRSVPLDPGSEVRLVAAVDDERVWVASFHDYDLRLLGAAGDTLLHIDTAPAWWRPASAAQDIEALMDLSPAILDIGVDCTARLWVAAGIPSPDPAVLERVAEGDIGALRETADHVLRVHERDGRLIAERRFDYMPLRFLGGDIAYSIDPDETHGVRITVWRVGVAESAGVTEVRGPQPGC